MSTMNLVEADWLALRGPADDAARSAELAAAAARLLDRRPIVIHDLGSGTGAMMRWLSPRLPGPQTWVLHDGDPAILARRDDAPVFDVDGQEVAVRTRVEHLGELAPDALAGASLVTASALLDVVTLDEARAIVAACVAAGAPALLSLSVTGRVELDPADEGDAAIAGAFDDHQRRDAGGRRMLGPAASGVVAALFSIAGWRVRVDGTPWRLGPSDRALIAEWIDGRVAAAIEQRPELAARAAAWRARREGQLDADALRIVVQHEDVLAWPS